MAMKSIEICAGAGGQAIGLESAGFHHEVLVEIDKHACETLRINRKHWNVVEQDVRHFDAKEYRERIDLFAGGVPCPPFSIAGKQLGPEDERDLFPEVIRLVSEIMPRAIMIENVKGLLSNKFYDYRKKIETELMKIGYLAEWKLLNAMDFGVPQSRQRTIMVAMPKELMTVFNWPQPKASTENTVADVLYDEMSSMGWSNFDNWHAQARSTAPTLVGGSKKHGGADLGPTRAREAWLKLGIDGKGIADSPPINGYDGLPRLTVKMAALIQGFPKDWVFYGKKTAAYRQVGNAFPPPVAEAVGREIYKVLAND
jgi:DNA (cytosine-5)-methyltransferase 1